MLTAPTSVELRQAQHREPQPTDLFLSSSTLSVRA
jgi:hypothetical protein